MSTFKEDGQDGRGVRPAASICVFCVFTEDAQDGRGVKLTARGFTEFPACLAASIRVLCASMKLIEFGLLFAMMSSVMHAQSLLGEINQEHNPSKRVELALSLADDSFDHAHDYYEKGAMDKGDAALENMTNALNACVQSLSVSKKARYYKKAELKVAYLQRRMNDMVEEMSVERRGWAEQTKRRLEAIHDKILDGVMSK